jgi:Histidine kinase-, DNA gyrase B-, and HSP90-like ATPase
MTKDNTAKKYNSEDFQETHFGIRNKEDLVHIFNVLRNKMYTNKVLAVLREYSTNACDSHIESGQKQRPIRVTLPTVNNRVLTIRDFGTGLSEDDIRNVYTMYGASTKRGSSELNGQLGFGSKAAFSYVDNYQITSYQDGVKSTYEAYVDETGLGAISLINKEDTTEPNGIEIKINVQVQDVNNFKETAVKLYKHFAITPEVINLGDTKIEKPIYRLKGTIWGLRSEETGYWNYRPENMGIMGNVAYPLNKQVLQDNFKNYKDWDKFANLLNCPIDFFLPVGQLNIAASREALEYDKKTLKAFHDTFDTTVKEIVDMVNKQIAAASDIVEAKAIYKTILHGELKPIAGLITSSNSLRWRDQDITDYSFTLPRIEVQEEAQAPEAEETETEEVESEDTQEEEVVQQAPAVNTSEEDSEEELAYSAKRITRGRYGVKSTTIFDGASIEFTEEVKTFVQDAKDKPILRIRKYFEDNPKVQSVTLIKPTHTTIENIAEEMGIDAKHFIKISTVEPLKEEVTRRTGPSNIKHSKRLFNIATTQQGGYGASRHWNVATAINTEEEYYYVYLDRFTPKFQQNTREFSFHQLDQMLSTYESISSNNIRDKVIGIKQTEKPFTIPPNWKSLESKLTEAIPSGISRVRETLEDAAYQRLRHQAGFNLFNNLELRSQDFINLPSIKALYDKVYSSTAVDENLLNQLKNLARLTSSSVNIASLEQAESVASTKVLNEYNKVFDRYPILRYFNFSPYARAQTQREAKELLKEYFQFVDKKALDKK